MRTKSRSRVLFAVLVTAPLAVAVADDPFRCDGRLVEAGMTMTQVTELCGEPTSPTTEVQDVHGGNRVVGTTQVQRWTYTSYSGTRVLVFDQETLKSIE